MANITGKGGFKDNPSNINRDGRPKGVNSIPDLLRKIGEESVPPELKQALSEKYTENELRDINMQEAVLRATYMYAVSGKPWAVQFIADRTEGKPVMTMTLETHEPVQLIKTGNPALDEEI
tara:strand:- start:504 stop:866 length:363 start_codon:yes stop_codon:yes gene_type:complete